MLFYNRCHNVSSRLSRTEEYKRLANLMHTAGAMRGCAAAIVGCCRRCQRPHAARYHTSLCRPSTAICHAPHWPPRHLSRPHWPLRRVSRRHWLPCHLSRPHWQPGHLSRPHWPAFTTPCTKPRCAGQTPGMASRNPRKRTGPAEIQSRPLPAPRPTWPPRPATSPHWRNR